MPKTSIKFGLALVAFFVPLAVSFAIHTGAMATRSVSNPMTGSNGESKCVQASRADEQTGSTHPDGVCLGTGGFD
jgi:hypothetical protein